MLLFPTLPRAGRPHQEVLQHLCKVALCGPPPSFRSQLQLHTRTRWLLGLCRGIL